MIRVIICSRLTRSEIRELRSAKVRRNKSMKIYDKMHMYINRRLIPVTIPIMPSRGIFRHRLCA